MRWGLSNDKLAILEGLQVEIVYQRVDGYTAVAQKQEGFC